MNSPSSKYRPLPPQATAAIIQHATRQVAAAAIKAAEAEAFFAKEATEIKNGTRSDASIYLQRFEAEKAVERARRAKRAEVRAKENAQQLMAAANRRAAAAARRASPAGLLAQAAEKVALQAKTAARQAKSATNKRRYTEAEAEECEESAARAQRQLEQDKIAVQLATKATQRAKVAARRATRAAYRVAAIARHVENSESSESTAHRPKAAYAAEKVAESVLRATAAIVTEKAALLAVKTAKVMGYTNLNISTESTADGQVQFTLSPGRKNETVRKTIAMTNIAAKAACRAAVMQQVLEAAQRNPHTPKTDVRKKIAATLKAAQMTATVADRALAAMEEQAAATAATRLASTTAATRQTALARQAAKTANNTTNNTIESQAARDAWRAADQACRAMKEANESANAERRADETARQAKAKIRCVAIAWRRAIKFLIKIAKAPTANGIAMATWRMAEAMDKVSAAVRGVARTTRSLREAAEIREIHKSWAERNEETELQCAKESADIPHALEAAEESINQAIQSVATEKATVSARKAAKAAEAAAHAVFIIANLEREMNNKSWNVQVDTFHAVRAARLTERRARAAGDPQNADKAAIAAHHAEKAIKTMEAVSEAISNVSNKAWTAMQAANRTAQSAKNSTKANAAAKGASAMRRAQTTLGLALETREATHTLQQAITAASRAKINAAITATDPIPPRQLSPSPK